MSRYVYVNGRYCRYGDASVHVEDRGFQFSDAVYEVIEVHGRGLVDLRRHLDRLWRSLGELGIAEPMSRRAMELVIGETVRRNRVRDGIVYLQVTRGAAPRDFHLPGADVAPTFVCLARAIPPDAAEVRARTGIRIKTVPDIRWGRCDIKTVMLLPACLAKAEAHAAGASDAWLVDGDGLVTEGASSNAWIVTEDGIVVTRALGPEILPGVTRRTVTDVLEAEGLQLQERAFSVAEARSAREAFVTSASSTVMPVVAIDGSPISDGKPGAVTMRLRHAFRDHAEVTVVG